MEHGGISRVQPKDNAGASDGIPALAKVLLVLETVSEAVMEVKTSVKSLQNEIVVLRGQAQLDQMSIKSELHKVQNLMEGLTSKVLESGKTRLEESSRVRQLQERQETHAQEVQASLQSLSLRWEEQSKLENSDWMPRIQTAESTLHDLLTRQTEIVSHLQDQRTALEGIKLETTGLGDRLQTKVQALEVRMTEMPQVLGKLHTGATGSDLPQIVEAMEEKFKSYADVARSTQKDWLEAQEREREARMSRRKNLRVVGLLEEEAEDTPVRVASFFKEVLKVNSPVVEQATRIGRSDKGARTILVRFRSTEEKAVVLNNRSMLKGHRIWLDEDLTPAQTAAKQKELLKVREANNAGFIAYLRDGCAVSDVLLLAETWETGEQSKVDIIHFTRLTSVWNHKGRGRGHGGIAVWVRQGLRLAVSVEKLDTNKQFIVLRVQGRNRRPPVFVVAVYFAPQGAPVYAKYETASDPFHELSKTVTTLQEAGVVYVLGDFNSRIGNWQTEVHEDTAVWRSGDTEPWTRVSADSGINGFAEYFRQFASVCDLTILNGTSKCADTEHWTFSSHAGASIVDFLLASRSAREGVVNFHFGPFCPESDHRAILFSIGGFQTNSHERRSQPLLSFFLNPALKGVYEREVESRISGSNLGLVPLNLMEAAKTIFPSRQTADKVWCDDACRQARVSALNCDPLHRREEFRSYKNFVRARRRRWLQARQNTLAEELRKKPQIFWKRLRSRTGAAEISSSALQDYIKQLYWFADAEGMPVPTEDGCTFRLEEVERELKRMEVGKSADLSGLSAELLKWGGTSVAKVLTLMLNRPGKLPEDWLQHKVVPLYKAGPQDNPSSYRTIMYVVRVSGLEPTRFSIKLGSNRGASGGALTSLLGRLNGVCPNSSGGRLVPYANA
ncbi:hypothetical protein R1sor_010475 [Riccia sorocarpa]|uniref:Endonuclease/exonuclease/phosphatase domain-containing protein n=1 Tax=Riccia sorocarpa TaxID=122646 RepID=A0ABD3I024_9MARC